MEINLDKFEDLLSKKNNKVSFNRPASCFPQSYTQEPSQYERIRQASLFRKPDNIGCTTRLQNH